MINTILATVTDEEAERLARGKAKINEAVKMMNKAIEMMEKAEKLEKRLWKKREFGAAT